MAAHRNPRPTYLYLDFDSTLTEASTLPHLVDAAICSLDALGLPAPNWKAIAEAYQADLDAHERNYWDARRDSGARAFPADPGKGERDCLPAQHPSVPQASSLAQHLAYEDSLTPIERASIQRIERAGLFAGFEGPSELWRAGHAAAARGAVRLRPCWPALAAAVLYPRHDGPPLGTVTVLSVAWSRAFICGCLAATAPAPPLGADHALGRQVRVLANEIHTGDGEAARGTLARCWPAEDRGLWTGVDKHRALREDLVRLRAAAEGPPPGRIVYVGDAPTDLACLLEADVGIVMRGRWGIDAPAEADALADLLRRLGIPVRHVSGYVEREEQRDWEDVLGDGAGEGVLGNIDEEPAQAVHDEEVRDQPARDQPARDEPAATQDPRLMRSMGDAARLSGLKTSCRSRSRDYGMSEGQAAQPHRPAPGQRREPARYLYWAESFEDILHSPVFPAQ